MNRKLNTAAIALLLITFSSASFAEKGWRLLAGMEEDFVHETTASILIGGLGPEKEIGSTALTYGLELSFNCPLLQPPSNKIRQQVSFLQYKDGSSTLQTVQINPHYIVEVSPKLWIGGGPGVGYIRADVDKKKSNMLSAQLGASIHYNIGEIFLGGEARYQLTQSSHVGNNTDNGANSWQAIFKLGYNLY